MKKTVFLSIEIITVNNLIMWIIQLGTITLFNSDWIKKIKLKFVLVHFSNQVDPFINRHFVFEYFFDTSKLFEDG